MWFRTRSYRGGWVAAPRAVVPVAVARLPRGQYRHFRGEAWREQRHEDRAERHAIHREERAVRHEEHHEERALRHEEHREQKAEHRGERHGRRGVGG